MNKGFIILFFCFTINSCKPKKDYQSIAKYLFKNDEGKTFNIDSIDNYSQLHKFIIKTNYNSSGIYFDLDQFKISNDSANYKCVLNLFDFYQINTNSLACIEKESLKITVYKENFIVNDSVYSYSKMDLFDSYISNYTYKMISRKGYYWGGYWNRIVINDSTSFKSELFPILNTMFASYLRTCIKTPNPNLYYDSKKNVLNFSTQIYGYDYDIPPKEFKKKL